MSLVEQVYHYVQTLNDPHTSPENRSAADNFLKESFFRDEKCWNVLFQILQQDGLPNEVHFFAAQFLRTKIAKNFREIPSGQIEHMKKMLIELIKPFGSNIVVTRQLALAIADFSVQQPEWEDAGMFLVQNLTPDHTNILLEVLLCMPDEMNPRRVPLAKKQLQMIQRTYLKMAPMILNVLEEIWRVLGENDGKNQQNILKCFAAWSIIFDEVQPECLIRSQLFQYTFSALANKTTFKDAVESIIKIIHVSGALPQWKPVRDIILNNTMQIVQLLQAAFQSDDLDSQYNLARLFTNLPLYYRYDLLECQENLSVILQIILHFLQHPDHSVSEQGFNFWNSIQEERIIATYTDDPDPIEKAVELYMNYAQESVCHIIDSVKMPEDMAALDPEQTEQWYEHRRYGGDTLLELCKFLRPVLFLEKVCTKLQNCLSQQNVNWQEVEACFYAICSTEDHMPDSMNDKLKELLEVSMQIEVNDHVRKTVTSLLSHMADFAKKYEDLTPKMLTYVITGIVNSNNKKVVRRSAETLKDICKYSRRSAKNHFSELMNVYQQCTNLDYSERNDFIWALCELFPHIPLNEVVSALEILISAPYQVLLQSLQNNNQVNVHNCLRPISEVFRRAKLKHLNQDKSNPHPLIRALETIWEAVSKAMELYNSNEDIMEKSVRIIKSTMRTCPYHYLTSSLAQSILLKIVGIFTVTPQSCFLYLISIYVDEYGSDQNSVGLFSKCLMQVSEKVNTILPDFEAFRQNPEMVEDFFELLIRYLKTCPQPILEPQFLCQLVEIMLRGMRLRHGQGSDAILLFLQSIIRLGTDMTNNRRFDKKMGVKRFEQLAPPALVTLIENVLTKFGSRIMGEIFWAVTGPVSFHKLDRHCIILESWYRLNQEQLGRFMQEALQNMPYDTEYPTKVEFLQTYFSFRPLAIGGRAEEVRNFARSCDRWCQSQNYSQI